MIDEWWKRQFERLLRREEADGKVAMLEKRYLVLSMMAFGKCGGKGRLSLSLPAEISHFLDDADVRAKDEKYAAKQRNEAWSWLNG